MEDDIIAFLKKEVFGKGSKENPLQVIREMASWTGLLTRENIMKKLTAERS